MSLIMDQMAGAIYEKYSEFLVHRLPYVLASCWTTCRHTATDHSTSVKSDRAAIGHNFGGKNKWQQINQW
jgi:hypothetical protein